MARMLPDIRPTETYTESNFLRIHTFPKRGEPDIRLATLEHLYYGPDEKNPAHYSWQCKTVVDAEPMSQQDAIFIAQTYAEEHNIPVVYECHSEAE